MHLGVPAVAYLHLCTVSPSTHTHTQAYTHVSIHTHTDYWSMANIEMDLADDIALT
jgi:hypothetical protein